MHQHRLERRDLFQFMQNQVKHTADTYGDRMPQAFGRWFAQMYFQGISNIAIPDGAGDGKIDILVTCQGGKTTKYKILNTKFTGDYDRSSPVSFYDEITRYWQAFENRTNRTEYLKVIREGLRPHIKKLFKLYDDGLGELYFVTNHRVNNAQFDSVKGYGISILHLDDLLQYVAEHLEGAMPETDPLLLTGISNVLTPATDESEVPTSIVFARLIDFINYMTDDPFDLLFARNVRLWLGGTETNKAILTTFRTAPKEFAYSNNGITILCKRHTHDVGKQELKLENPRIVNGSQTLHSIREVDNPSPVARVMVRIIEVPTGGTTDLPAQVEKRKDIIHKISIRSNLQNPIRRWNLVSNDDFQNELARYFWDKHLYYERRQREWGQRKVQLTSVGIRRGPDLRWLTQLIAAYHYDRKKLGPAQAQGKLNELFEEEPYSVIRNTTPEKSYQLYLLGIAVDDALTRLGRKKQYIWNVQGYVDLSTFALLCRILREGGLQFGKENIGASLREACSTNAAGWDKSIKAIVDHTLRAYDRAAIDVRRKEGKELTPANYFKNTTRIADLMKKPIPRLVKAYVRTVVH